jgi:hypothetical protein
MAYHLAHFNLAMARERLDHPALAGFVAELDAVNVLATTSPGFVWMPNGDEAGNPAAVFGTPLALANISLWRSVDALRAFTYTGRHGTALRRRREWFEPAAGPAYVLWWVVDGHRPDFVEGQTKLAHLAAHGPTAQAFNFSTTFEAPCE